MAVMTQKIVPYLWCDRNAEEMVDFYLSLFDDGKILSKSHYGDVTPSGGESLKGQVLVIEFQMAGQKFAALNGGPYFKFSEAVSFFVNCDTQGEIDRLWDRIEKTGGTVQECGWIKDKFGFPWQIGWTDLATYMTGNQAQADRMMQAIFTMKKIDIATLERAAAGN
jgi:predicted 3-demethylubiquinone-9 3-methyltransferase (glyoxalase superfamily)